MVKDKDAALKRAVESITEGARKFEVENLEAGTVREYFLVMPGAEDIRQAQWEYAKSYNMALREGIFTSEELMDILRRRNIIGPEYDKKLEKLQSQLREKLVELALEDDKDEQVSLAREASDLRAELVRWNTRFFGPMNNTCENLATESRNDYLTSVVVRNKDGSRVWESVEDFVNEKDQELYLKARLQVSLWLEGLEPGFLENEPDQVVLREFEKEELEKLEQVVKEADEEDKKKEVTSTTKDKKKSPKKKKTTRKVSKLTEQKEE